MVCKVNVNLYILKQDQHSTFSTEADFIYKHTQDLITADMLNLRSNVVSIWQNSQAYICHRYGETKHSCNAMYTLFI